MKTVIVAAHGSRQKESAEELAALAQKLDYKVKTDDSHDIQQVVHAFLQFCDPSLETVIQALGKDPDRVQAQVTDTPEAGQVLARFAGLCSQNQIAH